MKKFIVFVTGIIALMLCGITSMTAQVTIGDDYAPQPFSVLELISNNTHGLRLPQMTIAQRNAISDAYGSKEEMKGLTIFNIETNCVETWNGTVWISMCANGILVTPTFDGFGSTLSYCVGATPVLLPTTSANGITGVWSPATISTSAAGGPTRYTFTPTAGQNVVGTGVVTLDVTVTASVTPAFAGFATPLTYLLNGAPVTLPTTSDNGITGTWSPATISTATAGGPTTYTFTPTAGQCVNGTVVTVSVTVVDDISKITDNNTGVANQYVGAFWRAGQTGERLIGVTASDAAGYGNWTATVIAGSDWIKLDNVMTNDVNCVYYPTTYNESAVDSYENNPNFDSDHIVNDGTNVGGNASATVPIYFRIGLKSKFTDSPKYSPTPNFTTTFPARYGVVLLTYGGGKTQRIWIRQGDEADYLMRKEDAISSGGLISRPAAVQFLPYNTTYSSLNITQVPYNNGMKTLYPSQAGAFLQWAATGANNRIAWDAYDPSDIDPSPGTTWQTVPKTYWTDAFNNPVLKGTDETCPFGYRRPVDGVTNANIGNNPNMKLATSDMLLSEMRQSLYLSPNDNNENTNATKANSVWGYYADGFFDRRKITDGAGSNYNRTNSAVSVTTSSIAYIGRLYFNIYNNASLFFPASGNRGGGTGAISAAGNQGHYWSSSAFSTAETWSLLITETDAKQDKYSRSMGAHVRCVRP